MYLDNKVMWKERNQKHKRIELKVQEIQQLIGWKSKFSLENKTFTYKTIIKPMWC